MWGIFCCLIMNKYAAFKVQSLKNDRIHDIMRQNTFDLQLNFSLYKTYTRYLLLTKLSLLLLTKLTLQNCPYQIVAYQIVTWHSGK